MGFGLHDLLPPANQMPSSSASSISYLGKGQTARIFCLLLYRGESKACFFMLVNRGVICCGLRPNKI